jgi:hypothetical protein
MSQFRRGVDFVFGALRCLEAGEGQATPQGEMRIAAQRPGAIFEPMKEMEHHSEMEPEPKRQSERSGRKKKTAPAPRSLRGWARSAVRARSKS